MLTAIKILAVALAVVVPGGFLVLAAALVSRAIRRMRQDEPAPELAGVPARAH